MPQDKEKPGITELRRRLNAAAGDPEKFKKAERALTRAINVQETGDFERRGEKRKKRETQKEKEQRRSRETTSERTRTLRELRK